MGVLGDPREKAIAPKGPPEAPQMPKTAKNEHDSKKIEKDYQNR